MNNRYVSIFTDGHQHPRPNTHTHTHKVLEELRRVKLGNDSGFKAGQSMAVYIILKLSPMTSTTQHTAAVQQNLQPYNPQSIKHTQRQRTRNWKKKGNTEIWLEKMGNRIEVKNETEEG